MNGHAAPQPPQRPLAAAAGNASPAQPAETKPAVAEERSASRFPGFNYLSGSSPQTSFQHHLNPSKPAHTAQGSSSPAPGAALVRPAFSPQVPAGSAQRS